MLSSFKTVTNDFTGMFNGFKPTVTGNSSSFFGNSSKGSSLFGSSMFGPSTTGSTFSTINSSNTSMLGQVMTYLLASFVIMLFILIIVHFFFTPIFQLHPGGAGIIPVPGGDDGLVYWNKGNASEIMENKLPIQGSSWGYSLILDTFIQNPLQFSNRYRILFSRGAVRSASPSGSDTLLGMFDTYNLVVGLKPDTNDMIISVLSGSTMTNNEENVIIPNVPVQHPFRLGIVVMERALEVYINGDLIKTRKFDYPLKSVTGPIEIARPEEANIAKFQLLKIWNRILTTSEMRYATPNLVKTAPAGSTPIPSISICS
jgi:hypothetical protein